MSENEKIEYPKIAKELKGLFKEDQEIANSFDLEKKSKKEAQKEIEKVNKNHRKRLQEIINEIGWPTISKVGKSGSQAAWTIAQHADADVEFQENCLRLLEENKDDVSNKDIAWLTDRVAINKGDAQIYGTQFSIDDGKIKPEPIYEKEHLNKRREALGLELFEESIMYKKMKNKK